MKKKYSLLANITTPQSASFARKRRIKGKSKQRSSEIDKMSKSLVEPGIMDYVCSHPRQTGRSLVTPVNAEQTYNFILKKKFTPKKPPRLNIMFGNYPIPKNLMVTGDVKIMEARKKQPLQAQQMSMPVFKKRGSFNATLSYDASKANDLDITSNTPKSSTTKKIPYSRSRTSTLMTTDTEADRPKAKGSEPKIRARQRVNSSKLNMFETEKRKEIAKEEAIKFKEILPRELGDIIRRSNGMISEQPDRGCIYKYYIELGNNGSLVKQLLTARSGWVSVDNADHANFIWTQWGDYDIFETMEYGKKDAEAIEAPAPSAKDLKQRQLKAQIPKKRIEQEFSAQGLTWITNSPYYQVPKLTIEEYSTSFVLYAKLEYNYHLADKKFLFQNMKQFYLKRSLNPFDVLPRTYHVTNKDDREFLAFERYFNEKQKIVVAELQEEFNSGKKRKHYNIWIVKPGENSNRGNGIAIYDSFYDIRERISEYQFYSNQSGKQHTYIIQKYIPNPLLINGRKFDIRWFAMMTSINGLKQAYFFKDGYLRTASQEFWLDEIDEIASHLTNDAIQKHVEGYGRFEAGNKLSYADFQKHLDHYHPGTSFQKDIYPSIKRIVTDTMIATFDKIDIHRRLNSFEIFGYDFMIDDKMKVWLIEWNTNPWLETSSLHLARIIPSVIDNALSIVVDPMFPEPQQKKKFRENRFELVYSESQ